MDIRQLECLVTIVDEGGFGRAGDRLGISQPAVSLQIRRLETTVGEPVFVRDGRSVHLTPVGEAMLPHARETLRALRATQEAADAVRGVIAGSVSFGVLPGTTVGGLPTLLTQFREQYPRVAISVIEAPATALIHRVQTGALDAAVTGTSAPSTHGLPHVVLLQARIAAVVSASHPLADRPSFTLAELLAHPVMCTPSDSGVRAALDSARIPAGLPLVAQIESGNPQTLINLAARGLGIAVVPDVDVEMHKRRDLRVIPITDPEVYGNIELIWTTRGLVSPAVREFVRLAGEILGSAL